MLIQNVGRLSMSVADAVDAAAGALDGLADRLAAPGRRCSTSAPAPAGCDRAGPPVPSADLHDVLSGHGLTGVAEVPRTWAAPVRLHAARRPRARV